MAKDIYNNSENDFTENKENVCVLNPEESFVHDGIKRITNVGIKPLQIGFSFDNQDFYVFSNNNQKVEAESAGSNWGMVGIGYIPTYNAKVLDCL